MSIEKLCDSTSTEIENTPYTQICNTVLNHIKDNDSFRIWAFLSSKTRTWKVIKKYVNEVAMVSEDKAKKCWSYLNRCNLIEYKKIRDSRGKILETKIRVLNGTKFDENEPFISKKPIKEGVESIGGDFHPVEEPKSSPPQVGKPTRVDNHTCGNSGTTKERDIQNKDFTKERKSFCPSDIKSTTAQAKPQAQSRSYPEPAKYPESTSVVQIRPDKRKEENAKKHSWADQKPISPLASVESQSTSYDTFREARAPQASSLLEEFLKRKSNAN